MILVLIAVVVIAALLLLGGQIKGNLHQYHGALAGY